MRLNRYFLSAFTGFLCLHSALAIQPRPHIRQNDQQSSIPASSAAANTESAQSSSINSSSPPSSTASQHISSTPASSAAASSAFPTSATAAIQAPSVSVSIPNPAAATSTVTASANALPLEPKLTPAIGVTGAILVLTGVVYAVIGIKKQWLYVFASAAYLTSLAVTVLIEYLMNPPVSNAVQGAFFVAAFVSGLIFGAIALVFPDITDGLGCLLGGFCLSMWFLTLKAGGLITSKTGRAIFIGCMSFAGFSLSFSHYTRMYGLIVSTAFAGATITVLGIDCLSRAGLKEFWLYLWGLNDNLFPLHTDTYPITRNMKAEIASIVIIFLFGLVSQLKLWKIVRERREKKTALRLEQSQHQERVEEELAKKNQNQFSRERAEWEALYGDKQAAASVDPISDPGSSQEYIPRKSASVYGTRESGPESVEMVDMATSKEASEADTLPRKFGNTLPDPTVTVRVLQDDHIQEIDAEGNPISPNMTAIGRSGMDSGIGSSRVSTDYQPTDSTDIARSVSARSSLKAAPPPPVVVPLPFSIPTEEAEMEDNASVSVVPESQPGSPKKRNISKRFSDASINALNRLSLNRTSLYDSESKEALIVPHIEDDRASSIAATLDYRNEDIISLPALSPQPSPSPEEQAKKAMLSVESPEQVEYVLGGAAQRGRDREGTGLLQAQSLTTSTDPKPRMLSLKRSSTGSATSLSNADDDHRRSQFKSSEPSDSARPVLRVESLKDALPDKLSKVALSYRTNEWAKHLEVAERPAFETIQEPASPGIQVDHGPMETAVPVNIEIIQASPPHKNSNNVSRNVSHSSLSNPYRRSHDSIGPLSRTASSGTMNSAAGQRNSSAPVPSGPLSRSSSAAKIPGSRSSSTPIFNQTLVESPMEERAGAFGSSSTTLLGVRESLVHNKASALSNARYSSSPNVAAIREDDDNMSLSERKKILDEENMPLRQRKQLIQERRASQEKDKAYSQEKWPLRQSMQNYESHQPKRGSSMNQGKREALLANWRESVRQDTAPVQQNIADDSRRAAMINERRQRESLRQQQAMAATYREHAVDDMMRSGQMLDAHREAMRRMQRAANKNAS